MRDATPQPTGLHALYTQYRKWCAIVQGTNQHPPGAWWHLRANDNLAYTRPLLIGVTSGYSSQRLLMRWLRASPLQGMQLPLKPDMGMSSTTLSCHVVVLLHPHAAATSITGALHMGSCLNRWVHVQDLRTRACRTGSHLVKGNSRSVHTCRPKQQSFSQGKLY